LLAEAGPSADTGVSGLPEDASTAAEDADARTPVDGSGADGGGVDDAGGDEGQALSDSGSDGAGASVSGPDWANWPMPNPADSGFPNPASYDTSVSGVVRDQVTGLTWQQSDVASNAASIGEAASYCAALRLAGYDDWRLPSRVEVWSIVDFMSSNPALDPAFSTIADGSNSVYPWTTTPTFHGYRYGATIFGDGDGGPTDSISQSADPWVLAAGGGYNAIRCVRGSTAQPSPHYTVQNGTVFDHGTGLTWQQGYDPVPSLPNGVASYCASLTLAGGGWRGPSVKELETIVDDSRVAPSLDTTVFQLPPNATNSVQDINDLIFYSDSPWQNPNTAASAVDFLNGDITGGTNTIPLPPIPQPNNLYQVRCVK
jgi:hypothetical protein